MVLFMFFVLMVRVVEVVVVKFTIKVDLRIFGDVRRRVLYGWWVVSIMGRYTVELWTVTDEMKLGITMRAVHHIS